MLQLQASTTLVIDSVFACCAGDLLVLIEPHADSADDKQRSNGAEASSQAAPAEIEKSPASVN